MGAYGSYIQNLAYGALLTADGTDPAPGNAWVMPVPSGQIWQVVNVFFELACSAAAGDRWPRLSLTGGHSAGVTLFSNQKAVANDDLFYQFGIGTFTNYAGGLVYNSTIADALWLPPGGNITITAVGLDVADQITSITYVYKRWYA